MYHMRVSLHAPFTDVHDEGEDYRFVWTLTVENTDPSA